MITSVFGFFTGYLFILISKKFLLIVMLLIFQSHCQLLLLGQSVASFISSHLLVLCHQCLTSILNLLCQNQLLLPYLFTKIGKRLILEVLHLRKHHLLWEDSRLHLVVLAHYVLVTLFKIGIFLTHHRIRVLRLVLIIELILVRFGYCGIAILVILLLHLYVSVDQKILNSDCIN